MPKVTATDTLDLSIPERIQLVGDIWDTIAQTEDAVQLTDEEKKIIEMRLNEYHRNPSIGSPWSEVKKRILNK